MVKAGAPLRAVTPAAQEAPARGTPDPQSAEDRRERRQRAQGLIKRGLVKRDGEGYGVSNGSIKNPQTFTVRRDGGGAVTCTCPEFTTHDDARFRCEHIWAVIFTLKPELLSGGEQPSDEAERAALRERIYAEFEKLEYTAEDIAVYMQKNAEYHGGTVLDAMPLEQLRKVAEGLEIK
jgi:hypothetical protein